MHTFNYTFIFKSGNINQVANALSRQTELLMTLKIEQQGLDNLKDQYLTDIDFADIWKKCMKMNLHEHSYPTKFSILWINYASQEDHYNCF